jgi:hypothetical protein
MIYTMKTISESVGYREEPRNDLCIRPKTY